LIGIDTNVLVRYILDDDQVWSPPAQRFIDDDCTVERPGYVNLVVLVELAWVLRSTHGWGRSEISTVISDFLLADNLVLEQPLLVAAALRQFKDGGADFADFIIQAMNQSANAEPTVTIDKDASKQPGFVRLSRNAPHG
jgi:predicted nucleic-acid-binding protein